jgi:large subunit ribosomal protein L18e
LKRNSSRLILASGIERKGKKSKAGVWSDVSRKLSGSRNNRRAVNVGEIDRASKDNSSVIVAGKVLGGGNISHKVTVAAFAFSKEARGKILQSGGACVELSEIAAGRDITTKGAILLG